MAAITAIPFRSDMELAPCIQLRIVSHRTVQNDLLGFAVPDAANRGLEGAVADGDGVFTGEVLGFFAPEGRKVDVRDMSRAGISIDVSLPCPGLLVEALVEDDGLWRSIAGPSH